MTLEDLRRELGELEGRVDVAVVAVASTASTQQLARRIVRGFGGRTTPPFTVLALEQTAGRGRRGRAWSSPAGRGLYATVVRWPRTEALAHVPLLAGIGVCSAVHALGAPARLKWPNDLLLGGRKVAGILIETLAAGSAVGGGSEGRSDERADERARAVLIGIGLNLSHRGEDLPERPATSLAAEGIDAVGVAAAARSVVGALDRELSRSADRGYAVGRFEELALHERGDLLEVVVGEERVVGRYRGLDELGRLLLEAGGEVLPLASAEVVRVEGRFGPC